MGLAAAGFTVPFAIQTKAIPVALTGRDVCGRAKTGSGKTLAFGVPMLARLSGEADTRRPLAMVSGTDSGVGSAGRRGPRSRCRRVQSHRAGCLWRRLAPSADRGAQSRRRRDRRNSAASHRPLEGERARPQQGRDRGARRSRSHGRRWLHAAGRMDPPQGHRLPPDHVVLGNPRRRCRAPRSPVHEGSDRSSHRFGHRHGRHDASSVSCRSSHGQRQGRSSDCFRRRQGAGVLPDEAGVRSCRASVAGSRRAGNGDPRRSCPGVAREGDASVRRR